MEIPVLGLPVDRPIDEDASAADEKLRPVRYNLLLATTRARATIVKQDSNAGTPAAKNNAWLDQFKAIS